MKRHELTNPAPQHLYKGIISAERVIAYINDRKEFEIVQYRGVKKIEEISPEGFSQEFEGLKKHEVLHSESENAWDNYFDKWYSGHLLSIYIPLYPLTYSSFYLHRQCGYNIFRKRSMEHLPWSVFRSVHLRSVKSHHSSVVTSSRTTTIGTSPNNPQTLEITELLDVSVFFSWMYYKTKGYKISLMP